jgi:hypothetical protein
MKHICNIQEPKVPDVAVSVNGHTRLVLAFAGPYSNTPLQIDSSPSSFAKCLTLGDGNAFVSVSATISSVGQ